MFRFANNWVMLGIVVRLPFRPDRSFCLPVLWRGYHKKGKGKKDGGDPPQTLVSARKISSTE